MVDLGASFFFTRNEGDRGTASRFSSTIQPRSRLENTPLRTIVEKAPGEQFDKPIYQPLRKVSLSHYPTLVVVVDALDECEKERDIKVILDLWSQLPQITTIRLELFLMIQPDFPILQGFQNIPIDTHRDRMLYDEAKVPLTPIQHDISAVLKDGFLGIRENDDTDPLSGTPLGHDWPGDTILQTLVNLAIPLSIIAATVCRYVGDPNFNSTERLEGVLKLRGMGHLEQMEPTYLRVLSKLPAM